MKKLLTTVGAIAALTLASAHASAQSATAITLVQGLPGITVDVVIDGSTVINDLAPGASADMTTYAGQTLTNVEVLNSADQTDVVTPIASYNVPGTGNWSLITMLDAGGTARLASFENTVTSVEAGNARFTVRHAAAAPAVDVLIAGQKPITGLTNGSSQELTLPVGTISGAQLTLAGDNTPIANIAPVTLKANTNTVMYIVGSANDDTIAFVTQDVALPAPAATTTTVAGATTTTVAGATTTTSTTVAGATTTTTTTTTLAAAPTAVNTGSPIDGNGTTIALIALGGLVIAGGSYLVRRRV